MNWDAIMMWAGVALIMFAWIPVKWAMTILGALWVIVALLPRK